MKEINCPFCGTKLSLTSWGRYNCPNHGIINIDEDENDEEDKKERKYIG